MPRVRLVDENGGQVGITETKEALDFAFKKGLEDPAHLKVLERYNQPVWYLSTEDYTRWAQEQYEKERRARALQDRPAAVIPSAADPTARERA